MCGGGGGGGSDYADQMREREAERQFRIDQGMQELERAFAPLYGNQYQAGESGQTVTTPGVDPSNLRSQLEQILDPVSERDLYDTNAVYLPGGVPGSAPTKPTYTGLTGDARDQVLGLGFTEEELAGIRRQDDPNAYSDLLAARYEQGSESLRGGRDALVSDDPDLDPIWDTVRQDYQDFALPQLRRQQGEASEDLTYALARGGQLTGSVGQDRWIDLGEQFALTRQDVSSEADRLAQSRQSDVLDTRRNLTNLLQTTADPDAVAQQATDSLTMLSSQPSFNSLGPLFQNATAGLAGGVAGQQQFGLNQQVNQITGSNPYTRDPSRGSGRVVR